MSEFGGSYGIEKLTHYKMLPEMVRSFAYLWESLALYDFCRVRVTNIINNLKLGTNQSNNMIPSLEVLRLIREIYDRKER